MRVKGVKLWGKEEKERDHVRRKQGESDQERRAYKDIREEEKRKRRRG